jgi:hypothetical protein
VKLEVISKTAAEQDDHAAEQDKGQVVFQDAVMTSLNTAAEAAASPVPIVHPGGPSARSPLGVEPQFTIFEIASKQI